MTHSNFTTLISAAQLHALLNASHDVFIADCSFDLADAAAGERAYGEAHITGAVYLHLDRDLSAPKIGQPPINGRHPLPTREQMAERLRQAGLRTGQQVVVYDRSGSMFCVRLWWMLRWLGHEAVAVLDGGLQAWQVTQVVGHAVTATVPALPRGNFAASASLATAIHKPDVAANLRTRARVLLDARAPERFRGEVEPMDPVAGHIPGAINRFYKDNLNADGTFKPDAQLHAEFTQLLGKHAPHEVVAQCGSGVTGCHNLLAMEHAGLGGALLYPGSWSEWCMDTALPTAKC
jgi:thiosulfate/3-mercaptopyruvate sulfurtransferase